LIRSALTILFVGCVVCPAWAADAPVKTLDAVTIEGEVRLPQVLFITSRDGERPLDFLAMYAPATSLELGQSTVLPSTIRVVPEATVVDAPAPPAAVIDDAPTPIPSAPVDGSTKEEVHR
jgi:hypothetical protein